MFLLHWLVLWLLFFLSWLFALLLVDVNHYIDRVHEARNRIVDFLLHNYDVLSTSLLFWNSVLEFSSVRWRLRVIGLVERNFNWRQVWDSDRRRNRWRFRCLHGDIDRLGCFGDIGRLGCFGGRNRDENLINNIAVGLHVIVVVTDIIDVVPVCLIGFFDLWVFDLWERRRHFDRTRGGVHFREWFRGDFLDHNE